MIYRTPTIYIVPLQLLNRIRDYLGKYSSASLVSQFTDLCRRDRTIRL